MDPAIDASSLNETSNWNNADSALCCLSNVPVVKSFLLSGENAAP